jgi:hypothetical protein
VVKTHRLDSYDQLTLVDTHQTEIKKEDKDES